MADSQAVEMRTTTCRPAARWRARLPVLGFTGLYLVALALAGRDAAPGQKIMYFGLMAIVVPALLAVDRRYPLGRALPWCFSLWGLAHLAGGLLPPPGSREGGDLLYSWWLLPGRLRYDQVVHAFGFGVTTWFCWRVVHGSLRAPDGTPPRPSVGVLGLCVAAGMGFGALNETVEFALTRFVTTSHVGDYENTGWDLVANLAGALVAAIWIRAAATQP